MIDTNIFQDKTAVYYTLGCKLNFSETSTIGKILREAGVRTARKGEKADICVVNTCSVTEVADKKCRQAIHRLVKQHPGAFVVVTGCYAQLKPDAETAPIVTLEPTDNYGQTYKPCKVVAVMKETGNDLPSLYKETSEGGLAKDYKPM